MSKGHPDAAADQLLEAAWREEDYLRVLWENNLDSPRGFLLGKLWERGEDRTWCLSQEQDDQELQFP